MKELLSIEDPSAGLLGAWCAGLNLGPALLRFALIVSLAAAIGCERSSKRHSAGLRTFVLAAFSATVSMLLAQYVYVLLGCKLPLLSAGSEVLSVCGAGFAEGLAPDADTAQVLQMEMEHREEIT